MEIYNFLKKYFDELMFDFIMNVSFYSFLSAVIQIQTARTQAEKGLSQEIHRTRKSDAKLNFFEFLN